MNITANTIGSGLIGASVTATNNELTGSCDNVWENAKKSALFGGLGAGVGNTFAAFGKAIPRMQSQKWWNNASVDQRLRASSNAFHRPNTPSAWSTFGVTVGNIGSNVIANSP